jgi:carbonic anhydrase
VHGLIYGLKDGRLRDLDCSIGPGHFQTAHSTMEAAQ